MRPPAQINEIPLLITRYGLIRYLTDYLNLVILAHIIKEPEGIFLRHLHSDDCHVLLCQPPHLLLYPDKVIRRKCFIIVKVVIKPVFYGRTYGYLDFRIELFYCLSHEMACAVPENFQTLGRRDVNPRYFRPLYFGTFIYRRV